MSRIAPIAKNDQAAIANGKIPTWIATWIFGILIALVVVGCQPEADTASVTVLNESSNRRQIHSDFQLAMSFLERVGEYEEKQTEAKILFHLRRWLRTAAPNVNWIADPLATRLPERFRNFAATSTLSKNDIEPFDVEVLLEASWIRDVSKSVLQKNVTPPELDEKIAQIRADLPREHQSEIANGLLLFDWVVRNIQTDADPTGAPTDRYGSDITLHASEVLKLGHGTAAEKARLFILLVQQMGIRSVMLGIERGTDVPKDWLPAILVNDKHLYLFDMRLGIPIPNADGRGIATLEQALDHPELLRSLDIEPHVYPVSVTDLSKLVAMIDATPAYMSQRMANIESAMTGDNKMVLTVRPSSLATALRACKGVTRVEIWTLPYRPYLERKSLAPETAQAMYIEQQLFRSFVELDDTNNRFAKKTTDQSRAVDRRVSLIQGRLLHLRGQYESDGESRSARAYYLGCRTSASEIETMKRGLREAGRGLSEERLAAGTRLIEQTVMRTKQNASFWLGLMAADRGDYSIAVDFFRKIEDGPWAPGAKYNLARSLEAIGFRQNSQADLEKAKAAYQSDFDSPQAFQCRIRARDLERKMNKSSVDAQ